MKFGTMHIRPVVVKIPEASAVRGWNDTKPFGVGGSVRTMHFFILVILLNKKDNHNLKCDNKPRSPQKPNPVIRNGIVSELSATYGSGH